jgi:hypothetical protein
MSLPLNQSVLVESPSLRTSALSNLDDSRAQEVLSKAKAIVFAVWNGSGWATTAQIVEYFSVTESAAQVRTIILDLVAAVPSITAQTPAPVPALPPLEQRLQTLVEAMKTLAELTGGRLNPYMEQHFQDFAANLLAQHNQKALTASSQKWLKRRVFHPSKPDCCAHAGGGFCYQEAIGVGQKMKAIASLCQRLLYRL